MSDKEYWQRIARERYSDKTLDELLHIKSRNSEKCAKAFMEYAILKDKRKPSKKRQAEIYRLKECLDKLESAAVVIEEFIKDKTEQKTEDTTPNGNTTNS